MPMVRDDAVFVGFDGEADFEGGEFAGGVAGVGAVAAHGGDAVLVEAAAGVAELEHQGGVFGLGGGEDLLLVDDLVDQRFGLFGGWCVVAPMRSILAVGSDSHP